MISADNLLPFLQKFGSDLLAVYGIGTAFTNSDVKTPDADVIVILKTLDKAPSYEWTPARFEHFTLNGTEVWFLYGTLQGYQDKELFLTMSFANWEWSVKGLKFASTLLYGTDIRNQLPIPEYDYVDIIKRVAYHLEPTPDWKLKKAIQDKKPIDESLRFSKAIFKFGFFLTAHIFPDANVFDKRGVFKLLQQAAQLKQIEHESLLFYELALQFRKGKAFPDFEEMRHRFMKVFARETMRHLKIGWDTTEEVDGLYKILGQGMGKYPFRGIQTYLNNYGWD